ncbi:MAG: wax ester/triacylglycerol synthase family O-acyltransferase [Actinomycetota bacterium]|nr:wax ester/triacylglycerol synthase family O-acyltransferase [Actinomycetota bacterium]
MEGQETVVTAEHHGDRLSPLDASFLQLESEHAHMQVAWCAMLSPPEDVGPPSIEDVRARIAARLEWVPRCRQRLLSAPLGLGEPQWVDDSDFDVANHVVELGDRAEPLSAERFAAVRDELLSEPLDLTQPLWQLALIPRLADERMAVIGRVHHAMADGTAAMQVAMLGLDVEDAPETPARWRPESAPTWLQRVLDPLVSRAEATTHAALDVARACARPRAMTRGALRDAGRVGQSLAEDLLPRAPGSQLNRTLGPRRTLVQHRVPLARLGDVARDTAATRNDAGLAAIAGALRALALERDATTEPLKALVPVNMRRGRESGDLGNRVSMTSVWLPLQLPTPAERLEHVRRQTRRFKRGARAQGARTLLSGLGFLPSSLRAPFLRAATPRRFNLTISSVPGPPKTLYMHGARLEEIYPVVPMTEEQALSIGMLAYDGHMHFGLFADPDALPHATRLAELIDDELDALHDAGPPDAPLPVVAPAAARPLGTYEDRPVPSPTEAGHP